MRNLLAWHDTAHKRARLAANTYTQPHTVTYGVYGVEVEFTTRKTHHIIFILNYCHKQPKSFIINFNGYRHIDILATSIEHTRAVARHNKTRGVDIGSGEVKYGLI